MFSLLKLVTESSICEIHIGTKKMTIQQQREFMLALVNSTYNLGNFLPLKAPTTNQIISTRCHMFVQEEEGLT